MRKMWNWCMIRTNSCTHSTLGNLKFEYIVKYIVKYIWCQQGYGVSRDRVSAGIIRPHFNANQNINHGRIHIPRMCLAYTTSKMWILTFASFLRSRVWCLTSKYKFYNVLALSYTPNDFQWTFIHLYHWILYQSLNPSLHILWALISRFVKTHILYRYSFRTVNTFFNCKVAMTTATSCLVHWFYLADNATTQFT